MLSPSHRLLVGAEVAIQQGLTGFFPALTGALPERRHGTMEKDIRDAIFGVGKHGSFATEVSDATAPFSGRGHASDWPRSERRPRPTSRVRVLPVFLAVHATLEGDVVQGSDWSRRGAAA